jgi:hypothetical protein
MIPGRFRAKYVDVKDNMVRKEKSSFKDLSAFLQEQGSLIERHMLRKLDIFTRPPKKPTEKAGDNKITAFRAKLHTLENAAEASKSRKPSEKSMDEKERLKESEQEVGRCPL